MARLAQSSRLECRGLRPFGFHQSARGALHRSGAPLSQSAGARSSDAWLTAQPGPFALQVRGIESGYRSVCPAQEESTWILAGSAAPGNSDWYGALWVERIRGCRSLSARSEERRVGKE